MLVEMVCRMTRWQPAYHALKKWLPVLGDPSRSAGARKKAIVALGGGSLAALQRANHGEETRAGLTLAEISSSHLTNMIAGNCF
jgi:hypothetical protein